MKSRTKVPAPRESKKPAKKTLHEAASEMKKNLFEERMARMRKAASEAHRQEEDEIMDMIHGPARSTSSGEGGSPS